MRMQRSVRTTRETSDTLSSARAPENRRPRQDRPAILICAPLDPRASNQSRYFRTRIPSLPARWRLPILGPQVKLALCNLARDCVALDPPAAAQNNSHRRMRRELVRCDSSIRAYRRQFARA